MRGALTAVRTLADVVVAPRAAWRCLASRPQVVWMAVWVSALQMVVTAVQAHFVWAVVATQSHEWLDDARRGLAATRVLTIAAVPIAAVARALAWSALLGLAAPAPRPTRVALALALESVPLLESAATAVLIAAAQPADVDALRAVRLRAGLDVAWRPQAAWADALVGAASAFSIWWAALLGCGAVRVLRARWQAAWLVAVTAWLARVAWRAAWMASP
jgi:hypothetical protein